MAIPKIRHCEKRNVNVFKLIGHLKTKSIWKTILIKQQNQSGIQIYVKNVNVRPRLWDAHLKSKAHMETNLTNLEQYVKYVIQK
jgi:hypothetical protein